MAALVATTVLISASPVGFHLDGWPSADALGRDDSALTPPVRRVLGADSAPGSVTAGLYKVGGLTLQNPNADVWAHGDFAYVSTTQSGDLCPATGIRVVDISDPTQPLLVTRIPSHPSTRANDVKVARVTTTFFDGVLLAHSDEPCESQGIAGFHLFDVTNPSDPVHLSNFSTGPVHNLYLYQRGAEAYVLLAIPSGEVFGPGRGTPPSDFQIVNVTDPSDPSLIGEWTIGRDGGSAFGRPSYLDPSLPPGSDCTPPPGTPSLCRGMHPGVFNHDVWASEDGTVAYLSYWDAGLILLNISDPSSPTLIGRGIEPLTFGSEEGNLHHAVPARGGELVLLADEDFAQGPWGFVRIFDTSDPTDPIQIGAFATENSLNTTRRGFSFTAHNIAVRGDLAFIAWWDDGIRVIDFSQPTNPREIVSDRQVEMWGVYVLSVGPDERDVLILGSDRQVGLHLWQIDDTPPVSSLILQGTLGDAAWYVSTVTATLDVIDTDSGVDSSSYRVDGGPHRPYTAPFTVAGDGVHSVEYFSTDNVGVTEPVRSISFSVDTTAPAFTTFAPAGTVTQSMVTVSWAAEDATSGLARYEVSVDGVAFQPVGDQTDLTISLPDGDHLVRVVAIDVAGNTATAEVRFRVDTNIFSPSGPYGGLPLYGILVGTSIAVVVTLFWWRRRRGKSP